MSKLSLATLCLGVGLFVSGCGKTSSEKPTAEKATSHGKHATGHKHSDDEHSADPSHDHDSDHHKYSSSLEKSKRLIELQAQRAKKDIDDVTAEAERALNESQDSMKQNFQSRTRELAERAAELAEEAKDRAEDAPEDVDNAVHSRLKQGLHAVDKRLHKASEDESEDDR